MAVLVERDGSWVSFFLIRMNRMCGWIHGCWPSDGG